MPRYLLLLTGLLSPNLPALCADQPNLRGDCALERAASDSIDTYNVTAEWTAAHLVIHFQASDGQRTDTFVLDPDETNMKLVVDLTSAHLPGPIHYVLVFHRLPHV
jgi:hypothetical protein